MKQKIVVRIPNLNSEKIRAKAMKIIAKLEGVGSIKVQGENKDEIMVIGEVDAVEMTSRLRKKLGSADVVSVGKISEDNDNKSEDNNDNYSIIEQVQQQWFSPYYPQYLPYHLLY